MRIYTDGGCSGNPGPGGWAFCVYDGGQLIAKGSGGEAATTNNQMELTAVISALIFLRDSLKKKEAELLTDSQYVKNGITSWIYGWKKKNWRTASGGPVKNKEFWEALDRINSELSITWVWVKGHAGIEGNEECDQMVRQETARFL